jgi:hypothetical protein
MNTIKGLGIFIFFILLSGCFSPPEFDSTPNIDFEAIQFVKGKDGTADTLVLSINFQDGDGDIGLSADETDPPFHATNYFLENNGDTSHLVTSTRYTNLPPVIEVPSGTKGKLVTYRTRKKVIGGQKPYENILPPYVDPYKCTAYRYDSIFVSAPDTAIFNKKDYYLDRVMKDSGHQFPDLYVLKDTFYFQPNPYAKNIDITFFVMLDNGTFQKFEPKNGLGNCLTIADFFSARIPHLSENSSPVAGTLKYKMTSVGFIPWFGGKTIKLSIKIYDRALHVSNTIDTGAFQIN